MEQLFKLFFLLALIGILTFHSGCGEDSTPPPDEPEKPLKTVPIPRFDRDSAYGFVEKQVSFGPRVPNSEAHRRCKEWLVRQFKSFGARVNEQDFQAKAYTGEMLKGTNIIAQFKPGRKKRILLAAHWDSRHIADSQISTERRDEPIPGADDGGSGVAVLLEVARQLQENPIEMGVDIILFDAEDYGESNGEQSAQDSWCLGSQYWARNLHLKGYRPKYGILLDMVGAKGARFGKEQFSMNFAPKVMNKLWKLAKNMGYGNYFVDVRTNAVTDDHYYVNTVAKIPMIDVINKPVETQTGFGSHWHTQNDNMKVIDKRTLRAVGQVVLAVTYREANGTF